jgi:hypothetical protein
MLTHLVVALVQAAPVQHPRPDADYLQCSLNFQLPLLVRNHVMASWPLPGASGQNTGNAGAL